MKEKYLYLAGFSLFLVIFIFLFSYQFLFPTSNVLGEATQNQIVRRIEPIDEKDKFVALTFDDGPTDMTVQILQVLSEKQIKATFFVIGENIDQSPEILKQVAEQGHEIGNHTNTHSFITYLSQKKIAQEILITDEKIFQATGMQTKLVRSPYGLYPINLLKTTQLLDMQLISWNVDPEDWQTKDSQKIADVVMKEITPGSIILLHDGPPDLDRQATLTALPILIDQLQQQGYSFVTVSQLINQ